MALIFGVLTVVLDDPSLIKIKITVQNAVLAVVLLGSMPFRVYPFKVLLRRAMNLTEEGWRGLTLRYGLFFAVVAVVNEIVWRTQSDDTWIAFRGGLWIASSAFGIWQVFFIMKHMIQDQPVEPVEPDPGL
jgi:intracellular septation protein